MNDLPDDEDALVVAGRRQVEDQVESVQQQQLDAVGAVDDLVGALNEPAGAPHLPAQHHQHLVKVQVLFSVFYFHVSMNFASIFTRFNVQCVFLFSSSLAKWAIFICVGYRIGRLLKFRHFSMRKLEKHDVLWWRDRVTGWRTTESLRCLQYRRCCPKSAHKIQNNLNNRSSFPWTSK